VILSSSSTNSGKRQQVQYNVACISKNAGPVNTLSQIWDLTSVRVSPQLMSMPFTWINGLRSHFFDLEPYIVWFKICCRIPCCWG
jgi:hypothetical protein